MPKILIVDDSKTMRNIIKRGLQESKFELEDIVEARDAKSGLRALEAGQVDLVLADNTLPRMGGIEFVERLRAQYGTTPPVVLISVEGDDEVDAQADAAGADAVVKKPFTPSQLGSAVKPLLS